MLCCYPDSKVHGANMGAIWGPQDPDGPQVGPMNFAILVTIVLHHLCEDQDDGGIADTEWGAFYSLFLKKYFHFWRVCWSIKSLSM